MSHKDPDVIMSSSCEGTLWRVVTVIAWENNLHVALVHHYRAMGGVCGMWQRNTVFQSLFLPKEHNAMLVQLPT